MEKLFEIQTIILEQHERSAFYNREVFQNFHLNNRITGIVGSRGIGKTTYLVHQAIQQGARQQQALYISTDNLYFLDHKLIDLVDQLYKETDVRFLCIDEIQKYSNWEQELKNIADIYREFKILFSGSSMIELVHGKFDLSRRVTLYHLHGFSFREYLEFYLNLQLPKLDFDILIRDHLTITSELRVAQILKHFKEYLKIGYYPFFAEFKYEVEKFHAIDNAIQKTIYEDIASLNNLKTPTLIFIEKLYKYIINSQPGELSTYKLANTLGKDYESISEYFRLLGMSGLARFIYSNKSGKASLRNPIKMYPDNTNLIYAAYLPQLQDSTLGKVRETFVATQLQNSGLEVYYSEIGDFQVKEHIFEVGGKNKTTKQIQGIEKGIVLADGILTGSKKIIPLYLLGFLY